MSGSAARAATVSAMFVIGGPVSGVACVADTRISNPTPASSCSIDTTRPRDSISMSKSSAPVAAIPGDAENRASRLTNEAAQCEGERAHRLASSRTLLRSSVHDEIDAREHAERHRQEHTSKRDLRSDADEDESGVVPPLKEGIHRALKRGGEQNAEYRTGHRDQQTFGKHLQQDSTLPQADEPQDAHRSAPLVDQHQHQREQEHRARDDGDDGDGEVEAIEHDEDRG